MSKYFPYRLNLTYKAILAATLGLSTLSAYALTLGQPNITSEQHEPLSATINVSNIDANNFNASLANASIYQQMGLDQNTNIQVRFVKTSDTSGQLILSSASPISTPFTDIVLNLDNNGEQTIKPQTLLMPLPKQNRVEPTDMPLVVGTEQDMNLPIVGNIELEPTDEPLPINTMNPPTIAETEIFVAQDEPAPAPEAPAIDNQMVASAPASQPSTPANNIISEEERVISSIVPEGMNKQLNILTEQITRRVISSDGSQPITPSQPIQELPPTETAASPTIDSQEGSAGTYIVQSGDNLWSIANQIAIANNMNVNEVMSALHKQNPDAFSHGKINQLKANAVLNIPSYSVVPSQKAIQDAISAKKTSGSTKGSNARSGGNSGGRATNAQSKPRQSSNARSGRSTQPLPKAQLTLVAPSQNGHATGGQGRGAGNGNDELVGTLRTTRSQTAQNARRVNSLNQELSSATQKLQLQNQKLAELEARLKSLKDK